MKRVALIPLDERPVNTRYPNMIASAAGADVRLPPATLLSQRRQPGDTAGLIAWMEAAAAEVDTLIVSLEMIGHGGLIPSRITTEPMSAVAARLDALRRIRRAHPALTIYAFTVITRIPAYDGAFEEPDYWEHHGAALHELSVLYDRRGRGVDSEAAIIELEARIPEAMRRDWLARRLRNHALNLAALDLLAHDALDLLVISSDDTSPEGLGRREKRWIADWGALVLGDNARLLMYPGADEIGCALVARALLEGRTPRFRVEYAIPEDRDRIAPYEDGAVSLTVERQIRAVGGVIADEDADFVVMVNPPSPLGREYDFAYAKAEREYRYEALVRFVEQIAALINQGQRVIVADVAYPNGADPVLIELLIERIELARLAAYGAWNTAGNTVGTALAQGVAASLARTEAEREAHERFLTHRFIEDWAYQHCVREEIRDELERETGIRDASRVNAALIPARIADQLAAHLRRLPGLGARWRIAPGSVRLPWGRTFEIDFDLLPIRTSMMFDIAVIGGGLGGLNAALTAARDGGLRIGLFEESSLLGGQITAQGVSALDEHPRIETGGAPESYLQFRRAVRRHYVEAYGAPEVMPTGKPLNPGNGWVSRLCFDPRIGRAILERRLAEHPNVAAYTGFAPTNASVEDGLIRSVTLRDTVSGVAIEVRAAIFIDATELGDLLPLVGAAYVTGAEAKSDTGEPHAVETARPDEVQGFTVCFAVEFCPGEDHTIPKPEGYGALRDSQPYTLSPVGRDGNPVEYRFFETSASGNPPFWTYRRIHDGALLGGSDIALINWVSNDYHAENLIDASPEDKARIIADAKRLSMGFLYWLQTECPRDDGGVGYPELRLRPDVMMSSDGFAYMPYFRESRRIVPLTRIVEQDISAEYQLGETARTYPDSVGIGWYPMDLHPCVGNPRASMYAPTKPFHLPLGALISASPPRNLIAGCKNIGTTHLTNGAYRLHPVEWAVGEAAGALAGLCVECRQMPIEIYENADAVRQLQARLIAGGAPITWEQDAHGH